MNRLTVPIFQREEETGHLPTICSPGDFPWIFKQKQSKEFQTKRASKRHRLINTGPWSHTGSPRGGSPTLWHVQDLIVETDEGWVNLWDLAYLIVSTESLHKASGFRQSPSDGFPSKNYSNLKSIGRDGRVTFENRLGHKQELLLNVVLKAVFT